MNLKKSTYNKYNKPLMKTAFLWAEQSYCKRKKVGAVLAKKGRVLVTAYNGTVSGAEYNCCEELSDTNIVTKTDVVHAEKNAIAFAAKEGIKTKGCSMYVTLSPCVPCAILMKQAGIKKVYYNEKYRDTSGIKFLKKHGIKVKRITRD